MSILNIDDFVTGLAWVTVLALGVTVLTLGTWTLQFLARNRRTRVAQHRALVPYYRDLALRLRHDLLDTAHPA